MGFIVRKARLKDEKLSIIIIIIIIVTQTVLYTSLEFVHKQNYTGKLFSQIKFLQEIIYSRNCTSHCLYGIANLLNGALADLST